MKKLNVALIGAGRHSMSSHAPSLAHYRESFPDRIRLAALCDKDTDKASEKAKEYGFEKVYSDVESLLSAESLDACVAVTPIHLTEAISRQILERQIPLLIEKPLGTGLEQAESIVEMSKSAGVPVLVSVNRRFDPALIEALRRLDGQVPEYIRATMIRVARFEEEFIVDAGLHAIDAMRHVCGDIVSHEISAAGKGREKWAVVTMEFAGGTSGVLELLPAAGYRREEYTFHGTGYLAEVVVGEKDPGVFTFWKEGSLVASEIPAKNDPPFVYNGTYNETCEFFAAITENRRTLVPPEKIVQSMELSRDIHRAVIGGAA